MEPWPALTEDTARLAKLARQLVRAGTPVRELQLVLAGWRGSGERTAANDTQSEMASAASNITAEIESQLSGLFLGPALARGWLIGMLHEQAMAREQRRRQGAYYTPRGIASYMISRALAELRAEVGTALRVLDPAAGSGAFLLSALEVWHARSAEGASFPETCARLELAGFDLDADALRSARLAVEAACGDDGTESRQGDLAGGAVMLGLAAVDSLFAAPPDGADEYDIVVGNPPYLDSERLTRQQPGLREALHERFRTARGNWDLSCVFVERALELTRPGGVVAMLVPRKLLAADYAAALHELLLEHELVEACDLAGLPVFRVGVQAAVLIARRKPETLQHCTGRVLMRTVATGPAADQQVEPELLRRLPPGYFCAAFTPAGEWVARALAKFPPLADFAEIGDGCSTAEAYKLAGLIRDETDGRGPKLVNTGLIKSYATLWGARELVYLKQRYQYPRLDAALLSSEFPRRWQQSQAPKLLLPGLASDLWVVADCDGSWVCGKGAVQVLPEAGGAPGGSGLPVLAWAAWLNSAPVRWLYRALFGGRGFGAGSLHVGPRQLKRLPVPLMGLQEFAEELATLAAEITQEQQALLNKGALVEELTKWHASAAAQRIDELVRAAYGFVKEAGWPPL